MYVYEEQKKRLFTDEGQKLFLKVRDKAGELLSEAGAFQVHNLVSGFGGDYWLMTACVDRLVELEEIVEVTNPDTLTQYKVYIKNPNG